MKVILANTDDEKRISYRLRHEVMRVELGWIESQDTSIPEEMDEYDATQSIAFLAIDDKGKTLGTARLIMQGDIPLPVERYFDLDPIQKIESTNGQLKSYAEVSRFIVPPNDEYRSHEVTINIADYIINYGRSIGISHVLFSMDFKVFRMLRMVGYPLVRIGKDAFYIGSLTVPCIMSFNNVDSTLKGLASDIRNELAHSTI